MRRENETLESYKSLRENQARLAQKELDSLNEKAKAQEDFRNKYHAIRESRERKAASRSALMEAARNNALSTVLKAIYITALEAETLTDDGIILAESMVDTWIAENGGASKILGKVGNNTYLLSRITQIVEDAAEADVKEIESEEDGEELTNKEKKQNAIDAAKEFMKTARKPDVQDFMTQVFTPQPKEEKPEDDKEEKKEKPEGEEEEELKLPENEESKEDSEEKEPEKSFEDDPADGEEKSETTEPSEPKDGEDKSEKSETTEPEESEGEEVEPEEKEGEEKSKEEIEDETDDELGEPLDDDGINQDTTIDGTTSNDGKIFDELNKEEDVQKAVEIIRNRIADAEETFIKNNAEDKKKIEELLDKISNNVKTVEDLSDKDEAKAKVAEESVRMYKRHIESIKENRPLTVFEKMSRNLSKSIIVDESVRENYITESGTLDVDLIVEASKVMYGFLETVNTLQLEKVDCNYIKKVLDSMNKK